MGKMEGITDAVMQQPSATGCSTDGSIELQEAYVEVTVSENQEFGSEIMITSSLYQDQHDSESEKAKPVKKRKLPIEGFKKQRTKSTNVSQKQCKLDFPPCRVCLGKGSGLHYGVNSCESCKSFFRRCLTRKEEYKCLKDTNCPVTAQARGNCSGCRHRRCLLVGMSREAACLGRYTLSRRTKTILEAKKFTYSATESEESVIAETSDSPHENVNVPSIMLSLSDGHVTKYELLQDCSNHDSKSLPVMVTDLCKAIDEASTLELLTELAIIENLVSAMNQIKPFGIIVTEEEIKRKLREGYESYHTRSKVFGKMKPVPRDEYFSLLESTGIDIDGRQEFLRQSALSCQPVLHSYIAFANIIPDFSLLSLEDQCSLLKTSHFEAFLLLTYTGYDADLQMILTETGKAYHIDQAADIFYSRNLIMSIFDVCSKIQSLELTQAETAFLLAIAVTFGDRCVLENCKNVDKIQLTIVQMFRSHLCRTRPDQASRFFTKVVDCFIAMRAVGDQYLKEYGVICQDKLVQKEAPIWLAYIDKNKVREAGAAEASDTPLTEPSNPELICIQCID